MCDNNTYHMERNKKYKMDCAFRYSSAFNGAFALLFYKYSVKTVYIVAKSLDIFSKDDII